MAGKRERSTRSAATTAKERMANKRALKIMSACVLAVVVFCGGFALGTQSGFLTSLGFDVDRGGLPAGTPSSLSGQPSNSLSARIGEVEALLNENSIDEYGLDAATASMLGALSTVIEDPYLQYFDAERYSKYVEEVVSEPYAGVGVLFSENNGRAYVADVFEGSAAYLAGVRQGDYVMAVNGDRGRMWSMTEAVAAVSLDEGATVTITWMRPSSPESDKGEEFTTTLECSVYKETNVSWYMDGSTGVVRLRQITQDAAEVVERAVGELTEQGATSLVLDVRDNPGGYLTQAVSVANLFVPSGVLVEIQTVDGSSTRSATGGVITNAPLIVLVNNYTSASAEVLVAALQDNQRATVVGEATRGKGSVQAMRELSFGGALRYTAARYVTPLGHAIDGRGVMPDVSIGQGDEGDAQLGYALEAARSQAHG